MPRLAQPIPLPPNPPNVTEVLEEPVFEPERHLALEEPERVWSLREFGYSDEECADTPSPVAITSPFRILSDEGVTVMRQVAMRLLGAGHTGVKNGPGGTAYLRGGVYQARFLYDFMHCPELLDFMTKLAGTPLAPHPFPLFQAYFNFWAEDTNKNIDDWHVDSLGYDAVIMISNPSDVEGGAFEYYRGSRSELVERFGYDNWEQLRSKRIAHFDDDKIVTVEFPAAGYGMFMQGDYVCHRAARAISGERITMVPGYTSLDLRYPDRTNSRIWGGPNVDPVTLIEHARVFGWLGREKLAAFVDDVSWDDGTDLDGLADWLESAVSDVNRYVTNLRAAAALREAPR